MGLFDKVLGNRAEVSLSTQEAFAGVMLAIIAADGHISDEEAQGFNATVGRMKLFRVQSAAEHSAMIDKLFGILKRIGSEQLLRKSAEALRSDLKETAFAVVADLVFADGSVEDEERRSLEALQMQLAIPESLALEIVRVVEIKNRG